MLQGPALIFILLFAIIFIILATSRWKIHPFLTLLIASYGIGFAAGLPVLEIGSTIREGFGGLLGYIGMVIILGTIIGVILEKSGAAITMANTVLKVVGEKRPGLAMTIIGYIVSIPVFCDSAYVILSSLKKSITRQTKVSAIMMSVALATGLYATHTLVPPTPGPIAAAGNLGLQNSLGLVIMFGLVISIPAALAGYAWATIAGKQYSGLEELPQKPMTEDEVKEKLSDLPSPLMAFAPIAIPILAIALGSIANFPGKLFGDGTLFLAMSFLGKPINALFLGFLISLLLVSKIERETLNQWIEQGLKNAAIIIMITGAGGALGAVLKATEIGDYLGKTLASYNLGIFLPFIVAAALKTAQGSSTVALVTTSALLAPLLGSLGLDSEIGRVLTVMAIGAGAMTVSHANDSYFWVVAEFSEMDVSTAYKTHTIATLIQGVTALSIIAVLSVIL